MSKPDYDTSLARMAGNIAAGLVGDPQTYDPLRYEQRIVEVSVSLARAIVKEIKRTASPEPQP